MSATPTDPRELAADVVVAGFGGAGASAAIAAHDAGADVLVIEKAAAGGGATAASGGSLRGLSDFEGAVRHLQLLAGEATPRELFETYVHNLPGAIEWLREIGAEIVKLSDPALMTKFPPILASPFPMLPGTETMGERLRVKGGSPGEMGGVSLWRVLERAVEARKIRVRYSTAADRLIQGPDRGVTGLEAHDAEGKIVVHARRGVVLTTGGFSHDAAMVLDSIGVALPAFGSPDGATGDGVRMAAAAGAALWHMSAIAVMYGYRIPGYRSAFRHAMSNPGYIYVDRRASRFIDETGTDFHSMPMAAFAFDPLLPGFPRIPSYAIFDEQTRLAGPVVNLSLTHDGKAGWSSDNSREVAAGWIQQGRDAAELAARLGLPAPALVETLREFNAGCAQGSDAYGRAPKFMRPLEPPFYGIAIWPTLANTQGGPRRSTRSEVLDPFGRPIAGLFSAGELGSIWSQLYPGAGNLGEALVYGRIAGTSAAASASRSR